jgi:hypothetical protein
MIQENFTGKGDVQHKLWVGNPRSKSRRTVGISKGISTSKSKGRSTSTTTHGRTTTPERKIELCTPNIVDLPIINLQDARRPFKIKVSTICMTIARALERFN